MKVNNELSLNELHAVHLDMMKAFDAFCSEHKIQYFLAYGTLLGAVRHNGFIPWDDDVDILVPRGDFEKLIQFSEINEQYQIVSHSNNQGYYHPFHHANLTDRNTVMVENEMFQQTGKGVYIDIFPLDGVPSGTKEQKKYCKKVQLLKALYNITLSHSTAEIKDAKQRVKETLKSICRVFLSEKVLYEKLERNGKKYDEKISEFVSCTISMPSIRSYDHYIFRKADFVPTYHAFEGAKFVIPKGYDSILSNFYGDYMTPPPEAQRERKHDINYLRRDTNEAVD